MLEELYIKNVALIDELRERFGEGLNVLSGETGAGKSIIIDSIGLILGSRADRELIKSGADRAFAEAVFSVDDPELDELLSSLGIEPESTLILTRELQTSGKSGARVNGRAVSASVLREIAARLVTVYGQHDLHTLLGEENHLSMLDSFCGSDVSDSLSACAEAWAAVRHARDHLASLSFDEAEKQRMLELYTFQLAELREAELKPGEEEELTERRTLMQNAERIARSISTARSAISSGEKNARSLVYDAARALDAVESLKGEFADAKARLDNIYYELEDISYTLGDSELDFSEAELTKVEDRLAKLKSLKRKYGEDVPAMLSYLDSIQQKLHAIEDGNELIERARRKLSAAEEALSLRAAELTAKRREGAERFSLRLTGQLRELGMPDAHFQVRFQPKTPDAKGADAVAFYLTVNKGEPLRPLAKVASGGEASRIMLALKTITAERDSVGTLIFDEIDAGIGGRIAHVVAAKLSAVAKNRQVLCITHLPTIAAVGDANFYIEKHTDGERTVSTVTRLADDESLVKEIARLSSGTETDAALLHARELLEGARRMKEQS